MKKKVVWLILVLIMMLTSVGTFYADPGGGGLIPTPHENP